MKKIILALVILIAVIIGAVIIYNFKKRKKIDMDSQNYLTEIVYNVSGAKNGGVYNVSLDIKKKKLTVMEKEYYALPYQVKEYIVSEDDINAIKKMIAINKFPEWEKYELDDRLFVYDGASKSITFEYDKNGLSWYNISLNIKITSEQRKKLNDFISFFLGLIEENNLINEYSLND